tara:strand:- start:1812 stop:2741 length:930 start_codon:yes stop_codon:yes gene_type:complete
MKIGLVSKDNSGVDYHRLLKPFSLLDYDITRCEGVSEEMFDYNFDVVVFSRILPIKNQKKFIRELQKRGTYVICDIDDYWILSSNHVTKKIGDSFRKYSIEALMYADEVWTTHKTLGKEVERLNANWYVIPNALDPNEPQWQPKKNYGNRIGWAGGVTHFHDLMLTDGCWGGVVPVVCGFSENSEWLRLADSFQADYVNALPVNEYGYLYDQFDIAIAPLEDNKFNRCKSNLKIIEAGMKGLPIFVQNIHPYTDDSRGIFKVDSWATAISKASNMGADEIKDSGQAIRDYCLANYDLNKVNELRKERLG